MTDAALAAAVAALGIEIKGSRLLTSFGRHKRTWWVLLGDGTEAKLRTVPDAATAKANVLYRGLVADLSVPAILTSAGPHLLEPWVLGRVLPDRPTPRDLAGAAVLLSQLHAVPLPPGARPSFREDAAERVERLVGSGVVEREQATVLQGILVSHTTNDLVEVVLGHGDLCGENLVRDESGRIWAVDAEELGPRPRGMDLGIAWYRWELDDALLATLTRGIGCNAPMGALRCWQAAAVVKGLWFRSRHEPDALPAAKDRLDALLRLAR